MKNIKESVKILYNVKDTDKIVGNFAAKAFIDKNFTGQDGVSYGYDGFEVISESSIKVLYTCFYGDMEDQRSFVVYLNNTENQ